jgi:hypothetical protein
LTRFRPKGSAVIAVCVSIVIAADHGCRTPSVVSMPRGDSSPGPQAKALTTDNRIPKEKEGGDSMVAGAWRNDEFSWIRGANYTPSYAPNDVVTWRDFDPEVVDRELALAEKLKLNSVRTWLQYIVYENSPEQFGKNFNTFLSLCAKHQIKAMPILFDSCFGQEPAIDWNGHWVMNPGTSREDPSYWPKLQKYIDEVVGKHVGDDRVVMWDIMNEPALTPGTIPFVKHWCEVVRAMDPTHPVTVGVAGGTSLAMPFADDEDVLSMHSYSAPAVVLRYAINLMKKLGREKGKPVIITECCAPGWGQPYELVMPVLRETGIGWYVWEVTIGKNQFNAISGLLYPDGTCRSATAVAAVMGIPPTETGFAQKSREEGIEVKEPPPPQCTLSAEYIDRLLEMAKTPTTPENLEKRGAIVLPQAIAIGGFVTFSLSELRDAYSAFMWLSTPENAKDTDGAVKHLETLIRIMASHVGEIDLEQLR